MTLHTLNPAMAGVIEDLFAEPPASRVATLWPLVALPLGA
jgi:hypothetical protein